MSQLPESVELSHGAGGLKMDQLLQFIQKNLKYRITDQPGSVGIDAFDDGAIIPATAFLEKDIIVSTDAHTVDPIFFPGGDLGKLSICGTINDVVMMGARPLALTLALIIEEGFAFNDLAKLLQSMNKVCSDLHIPIIAGDTKVVPKGSIDKIMMVTTGIGHKLIKNPVLDNNTQPGDKVIVTGPVGSHGTALLSFREGLEFETNLKSDVAALSPLLVPLITKYPIHTMKDPTRGGVASALNEIAEKSKVTITIEQKLIPLHPAVQSAAELLGLDPLEITSEGQAIITLPGEYANELLKELKQHPLGKDAAIIGDVSDEERGKVFLKTQIGGRRRLQKPIGELIPRVC